MEKKAQQKHTSYENSWLENFTKSQQAIVNKTLERHRSTVSVCCQILRSSLLQIVFTVETIYQKTLENIEDCFSINVL